MKMQNETGIIPLKIYLLVRAAEVDLLLPNFKKVVIMILFKHSSIITWNGKKWLSLAIFLSFRGKSFIGRCDSTESHLPLFRTAYYPTAPLSTIRTRRVHRCY